MLLVFCHSEKKKKKSRADLLLACPQAAHTSEVRLLYENVSWEQVTDPALVRQGGAVGETKLSQAWVLRGPWVGALAEDLNGQGARPELCPLADQSLNSRPL